MPPAAAGTSVAGVGHRLDRVERRAAGEDGERAEDVRGRLVEEAVAPVDRRAQRALALGKIRRAPREQRQALAEPLGRALGPEHAHSRRGELDREREPVERAADPGDRVGVRIGQLEVGQLGLRPLDVEPDCVAVRLGGGLDAELGNGEGRYAVLPLGHDPERRPAGGEDLERGHRLEQAGDVRERLRQVLEVVEDEQRRALGEGGLQCLELPARHVAEVESRRDRGEDERRVGER